MALPDELAMGKNFGRGLSAGVDQTQAMLYGAAGLAGNALGLEGMEAWGKEGYQRNVAEAAQSAPAAGESGSSFVEADSFTDYANWAARTFGEQIPNLRFINLNKCQAQAPIELIRVQVPAAL
jgi:hypothetical protein